ncbi:phage tail tape measure protein [Anaeromassilibacillus senegalensis]|uniref:phage tail tape measure protein n=1 Tax=Anaeromassilibacillus senegalensis TaxID=1673717 RepID=UPI000680A6FA|nr:phage tail tape measure protein [Anaeromassilibacillus senegalensis]
MASRREYEMLFHLNAQLGSSYNGTFKSAQSTLSSMQKEVLNLSKTQSDISAFQKQQGAVEATRQKLSVLQQQYDNIQKEIKETEGYSSSLENKLLSKQQQIDRTSSSLEQQTQKLNQMDTALREAGVDTGNLDKESARLSTQMTELKQSQEDAAEGAKDFGEASSEAFSAVQQAIVAAGVATALKEIYEAFMECVTIAGDFEEAMSNVEALSGATAMDMADLSAKAKELGATTKFTAQESADAMGYMAMAGWDAVDMLSGMDGVLQLAAASGEDLAMVSDIVTDSLSAFGLTAADTAHFSDVLAATATNSNTNVSIMGETFKMSASVAGALGYSIEDVATAVGLMANSGIKGSIAGTALKNTFNGLLEGVTLTGAAFGEYEYSAIKADGSMKSFGGTINELRNYFDQMTEAERVNNAMTIAGQRGYNGLLAILNATDEDYTSLTDSINNCTGAAAKMAAIKLDNMNGQLTLMNSAWDALKTTIGEQFTPEMRGLYSIGTDVFGMLNDFVAKHPALVKAVMAFVAVLGTATLALTAYATISKVVKALDLVTLFTGPAGVIIGVISGVAALTAAIVAFATATNEAIPSVRELTTAAQEMNQAMEEANNIFNETVTSTLATVDVAETYIRKLEELEAAGITTDEQAKQYHNTLALLCRTVPELTDYIDLEKDTIEGGTEALRTHTKAWKENAKAQAYQEYMNSLYDEYNDVLLEAAENEIGLTKAQMQLEDANKKHGDTLGKMNKLYAEAQKSAGDYNEKYGGWTEATDYLTQEYYDLQDTLISINEEVYTAEQCVNNYTKAIEEDGKATSEAQKAIDSAEEAYNRLTGTTEESIEATKEAARQEQELQFVIEDITGKMNDLAEAYSSAYFEALNSVSGQYELWDKTEKVVATSTDKMNAAIESQITYWQNYNSNLQSLTERSGDIEGLSDVIASFADGSEDSVNAIAGMANASDKDLAKMVENWQALKKEQDTTAGSIADLKTDFSATMDELQKELAADIEAMNLGPEAAESGKSTIQGFIDGAADMLGPVQAAYARIAKAAQNALNPGTGGGSSGIPGYAVGTQSAAPGFAMVGENGPEIVYFNGGEQVMTATETAVMQRGLPTSELQTVTFAPQLLEALSSMRGTNALSAQGNSAGNNIHLTVAPTYTISGVTSSRGIEDILRRHDEDLRNYILEIMQQADIDSTRRAYR